jgi:hypothetical protein
MKPLKIAFSPDLRSRLESAAARHGRSIGEEVRARVQETFSREELGPHAQLLLLLIARLAAVAKLQTGRDWFADPATAKVFLDAVVAMLARWRPKGDAVLDPSTLPPTRPVALDDIAGMGIAIEGIVSFEAQIDRALAAGPLPLREEAMRQAAERVTKAMFETHQPPPEADTPVPTRRRKPKQE